MIFENGYACTYSMNHQPSQMYALFGFNDEAYIWDCTVFRHILYFLQACFRWLKFIARKTVCASFTSDRVPWKDFDTNIELHDPILKWPVVNAAIFDWMYFRNMFRRIALKGIAQPYLIKWKAAISGCLTHTTGHSVIMLRFPIRD